MSFGLPILGYSSFFSAIPMAKNVGAPWPTKMPQRSDPVHIRAQICDERRQQ
ncbi:hypothetical protein [Subtercola endophyticus]|uniref:hypothetical protein n=1 Tax=Subtercola endophyticus TaxID=2895559 RepID=UPI001E3F2BB4|nr:hypothetical protein [Subtercola endophyticus]UFS58825.1 hypothetical protein LQ955_17795 [Subtercola endophyticus]